MSLQELFFACKVGDIQTVRNLVEVKEVDISVHDRWDSTPLYYACLCGHQEVVQYLLEHGAKCEANTFDGERCLYGALTDEIRNLLRSYKAISKRLMRRDIYEEFLRKILESGVESDVQFDVHGETFSAHRCILSARCPHFAELFQTKWSGRRIIELRHKLIVPWAFQSILQYLYTGHMETTIDVVDDCIRLAKHCQLYSLVCLIEEAMKKALEFQMSKVGVRLTILVVEQPSSSLTLQSELGQLADSAVPPSFSSWIQGELPFDQTLKESFADMTFDVDGHHFMCHKVFFCERSEYFRALWKDHFGEASVDTSTPIVTLRDVSARVFHAVLTYVYQDSCELPEDITLEVLYAAEMYLLPGLKRLCAAALIRSTDISNVVPVMRIARLFSLGRLEAYCTEFMANNIIEVVSQPEFAALVVDDARQVQGREETDSIDVVDEIRFYLAHVFNTSADMEEAEHRLRLIDRLLEDLGIDG